MVDENKILKKFGAKLRKARLAKGLSQEKLALDLEFNKNYIGLLERGERNPSFITVHKIVKHLGIDGSDLL